MISVTHVGSMFKSTWALKFWIRNGTWTCWLIVYYDLLAMHTPRGLSRAKGVYLILLASVALIKLYSAPVSISTSIPSPKPGILPQYFGRVCTLGDK